MTTPHPPSTWIIPARAGFTTTPARRSCACSDHPRSRGVYTSAPRRPPSGTGSSPLARGLLPGTVHIVARVGIIPARAGFTRLTTGSMCSAPDHPRSRGVYFSTGMARHLQAGSSPLARGLHAAAADGPVRGRIIPARAGFTLQGDLPARDDRDHPRSRGVYPWPARGGCPPRGSSPLARGLPQLRTWLKSRGGIIPARAGFTWPPCRWTTGAADHPRSRGVYKASMNVSLMGCGSSPLARGLRVILDGKPRVDGIIPARAGFTLLRHLRGVGGEDHPRSRGVYSATLDPRRPL